VKIPGRKVRYIYASALWVDDIVKFGGLPYKVFEIQKDDLHLRMSFRCNQTIDPGVGLEVTLDQMTTLKVYREV
jgi:hypothetical protein